LLPSSKKQSKPSSSLRPVAKFSSVAGGEGGKKGDEKGGKEKRRDALP